MNVERGGVRRLFFGKVVGVVLGILLAGTMLIRGSFVPAYLAVLLASGLRNVYIAWLGSGVLFYAAAFVFLYLQAVAVTAVYLALLTTYQSLRATPPGESHGVK